MPVAPSFNDLVAQFIAEAQARRPSLAFLEGDVSLAIAHGCGAMADVVLRYAAQAFKATFYDGAQGDTLTAVVDDRVNIQRDPSTFAQVTVRFARTSGGAAGTIPSGTTIGTATDASGKEVRFTTNAVIAVALADNGPFDVVATCTVRGSEGDVNATTITRILDPLFDDFTVTNLARAGGGNEQESDPELRSRARNFWVTLRKGTLAALEQGALDVASVRVAKSSEDLSNGSASVVVTDSNGGSTAQMVADAEASLENWRAAGCNVTTIGGAALLVDVLGTMVLVDGVDPVPLSQPVADAIASRIKKLKQGELLYLDTIKAAGIAVDPDGIEAINLTTPTGTVTPLVYQLIRPGTIVIT